MSVVYTYVKEPHDLAQLHDELIRASLVPERVEAVVESTPYTSDNGDPMEALVTNITLTMPDGTVEGDVDAVVAAHVPMARYDPATQLARIASVREASRLLSDYDLMQREVDAAASLDQAKLVFRKLIASLKRRDRLAGLY